MKVAQVLFTGLGGHGSVAFSLVRGDRQRAHEHRMIFYGVDPLAEGYAAMCAVLGVDYEVVRKQPGLDLGSWRSVIAALGRGAPDVVLLHSLTLIAPAKAFARRAGVPLIAVDHLSVDVKKRRDWAFTTAALSGADRTVMLTREFAALVERRLGVLFRPKRVAVIGNGIDLDAFAPSATAPPRRIGSMHVGMHGRFSPTKDHATLVRAVAKTKGVHLSLAGDGETLAATRALIRELGVDDRIALVGMLPEADVPDFLRSLDVYVQSSSGEAMSTAVMQAMATGLPVVASDVRGLANMVRPDETGELFPLGDVESLARLLELLRSDPAMRTRLGRGALEHARRHWSQETMFRAYEALMSSLLADATSRNTSA